MFVFAGFSPDELLAIRLSWQTAPAKSLVMRGNDVKNNYLVYAG
jgi:hypothetical protein